MMDGHPPPDAPRLTASVAMATYNGAAYLGAQLDSILAQTEPPDEIVVTDDRSTDGTWDLLAAYAARSPVPIRAHRNEERLGFSANFMKAIGLCRSDLIFLCDQDDWWHPGKVERMKRAFADPAVQLAYHGALVVTADDRPLYEFTDAARERALLAVAPAHPWHFSWGLTQAFRSSLRAFDDLWPRSLNHIWIEDERLGHDQWYFFVAQVLGRVTYVDASLIRYRQHGANSVGAAQSGRPRSVWRRLRQKLGHEVRLDDLRARAAERRAALLDAIGERTGGATAGRTALLAARYRRLADRLRRRHRTHAGATLAGRVAALAGLVRHGGYAGHPWGFKRLSVLRDLAGSVAPDRRD